MKTLLLSFLFAVCGCLDELIIKNNEQITRRDWENKNSL